MRALDNASAEGYCVWGVRVVCAFACALARLRLRLAATKVNILFGGGVQDMAEYGERYHKYESQRRLLNENTEAHWPTHRRGCRGRGGVRRQ